MSKILILLGTRPEVIKLAPLILKLQQIGQKPIVVHTGQHAGLADDILKWFDIKPDFNLQIMKENQAPAYVMQRLLSELPPILNRIKPEWVVVQGDTSSGLAGAQAAFLEKIKVAHVEAGLRSHDLSQPFPEEMNRRLISTLASVHFAPTASAKENLLQEQVDENSILVTGNTVVDAMNLILEKQDVKRSVIRQSYSVSGDDKLILLTSHRRENYGKAQKKIYRAILKLADIHADYKFIFLVHPNPSVRQHLDMIQNHTQIQLTEPLSYFNFIPLMSASDLIMTDSGGIQEEAPALGTPVLVLRNKTERPELIESGAGVLVGSNEADIIKNAEDFLTGSRKNRKEALFGDGKSSTRITNHLLNNPF
jgi:UDP-N-acetylglucosamine 2-epimerase (non-hydrolysing)